MICASVAPPEPPRSPCLTEGCDPRTESDRALRSRLCASPRGTPPCPTVQWCQLDRVGRSTGTRGHRRSLTCRATPALHHSLVIGWTRCPAVLCATAIDERRRRNVAALSLAF